MKSKIHPGTELVGTVLWLRLRNRTESYVFLESKYLAGLQPWVHPYRKRAQVALTVARARVDGRGCALNVCDGPEKGGGGTAREYWEAHKQKAVVFPASSAPVVCSFCPQMHTEYLLRAQH